MNKYLAYYLSKLPYIVVMFIPTVIMNAKFLGRDISTYDVLNNLLILHFVFLLWEKAFPCMESFSFSKCFSKIDFIVSVPSGLIGFLITAKILPMFNGPAIKIDFPFITILIFFTLTFFVALDMSRCNADIEKIY